MHNHNRNARSLHGRGITTDHSSAQSSRPVVAGIRIHGTFVFTDAAGASGARPSMTTIRRRPDETPTNVLMIENSDEEAQWIRELLEEGAEFPIRLTRVDSLADGLRLLAKDGVDVVLLDLCIPNSSGLDALDRLRETSTYVPCVLLTDLYDETLAISSVQRGAQDYLLKSRLNADQLIRVLRYAIERNRIEATLRRYREGLEDLVRERTTELEQSNRELVREINERKDIEGRLRESLSQLEEHDRARTQFVANVSHELRTPLSSICNVVNNMLLGIAGPVTDKANSYLEMLRSDSKRLITTVNDILDLGRIEADSLSLVMAKVAFGPFVCRSIDSLGVQAEARAIELIVSVPADAGFVKCEPQRFERVILNIVQNAIKFTPDEGCIEIRVGPAPGDDGYLQLDVIDNGEGISAEHLPRVTERYYRVGEHVTGTGLGLALSKDILALHDGELELKSPPAGRSSGTHVAIRLPAVAAPRVVITGRSDDGDGLPRMLIQHGFEVAEPQGSVSDLDLLRKHAPDVVLIDLLGSTGAGAVVIVEIKNEPALREIPLVGLTGAQLSPGQKEILENFAVPVLSQPIAATELIETIQDAMISREFVSMRNT